MESNFLCPTRPILLVLGRALALNITAGFSEIVVILIGWLAVGLTFDAIKIQFIPLIVLLVQAASFGVGLFFAGLVLLYRQVDRLVSFFVFLMYSFGGGTYALAAMPVLPRMISYLLPITWGIEGVRGILIYNWDLSNIINNVLILLAFACVLTFFGSLLFRKFENRVKRRGGLSGY